MPLDTRSLKRATQRLLVEEIQRKRRSDDAERFAELFRRSTIDPNPHQIEAAMFALRRLSTGGAMLCDEVGLGKTIEAGLVITQLRAQSKGHVLIIVPLALARQWQVELQDLFSLRATIVNVAEGAPSKRGIYIVGRETAASPRGKQLLEKIAPWDLVIVDEAHEMFSTIHARYSKTNGKYLSDLSKGGARRAAQVKALIEGSPVLILTATPLQNNLYELWGLVSYIDPNHRILGPFNEYCELFVTGEGGRSIVPEMEETLRRRLSLVLKRTLRRQAQPFIKYPFRDRHVHTANFNAGKLEEDLYTAVSTWLAQERLAAYRKSNRALMALQLRRRMASSPEALLSTLQSILERMREIQRTGRYPDTSDEDEDEDYDFSDDGEEEIDFDAIDFEHLERDIAEVSKLCGLAKSIVESKTDPKKTKLVEVIRQIRAKSLAGVASEKLVIFTESVKTLHSLVEYLEANGFAGQITTFAGTNSGPIPERALKIWQEEVGKFQSPPLEESAAVRAALIHEFKTRTSIFISTEAGAKGLNLQFCNCLVNYDLPWNPQRIEQRIGRVHRYGQAHDVIIVNFINLSNEAEQRVYELLREKLDVFQTTLGASDEILTAPEIAINLEHRVNQILDRCRSQQEIQQAFDRLTLELDEAQKTLHDEHIRNARQLLSELDTTVQARLTSVEDQIGTALSECDTTLLRILEEEADFIEVGAKDGRKLVRWDSKLYHLGPPQPGTEYGEPLHSEHPLVQELFKTCIQETDDATLHMDSDSPLEKHWEFYSVTLSGFEDEEILLAVGPDAPPLPFKGRTAPSLESGLSVLKLESEQRQRDYTERMLEQIASRKQDLHRYGSQTIAALEKKVEKAEKERRLAVSPEAMSKAKALHTRLKNDLEKERSESQLDLAKKLSELEDEERRIRLSQFVEITTRKLFAIEQRAMSPRNTVV